MHGLPLKHWPRRSLGGGRSFSVRLSLFYLMAPVLPLVGIAKILAEMFTTLRFRRIHRRSTNPQLVPDTMSMSNKLRGLIDDILVILFGINQPQGFVKRTRIVANTFIVVGMSDSTLVPRSHINTDDSPVEEDNMADALTLGHKTAENSCLMLLNEAGKLALLESSSILPNYKQLRFLDGKSGIATLIIAVQAIGYVIFIGYRAILHLPVSPVEAIGFAFSMLVIVHSISHSVGVICQNPLVIYLSPTQEQEMLEKCESTRWSNVDTVNRENVTKVGIVVVGSVVVAFTILVEWHVLRTSWFDGIGPIIFLLSFIPELFLAINAARNPDPSTWSLRLFLGSWGISICGIVHSILRTVRDWQSDSFDSRTPSVIHSLPFLG